MTEQVNEQVSTGQSVQSSDARSDNPAAMSQGNAVTVAPGADNVVTLPPQAAIQSIAADGRDLVITLADGQVIVIPGGVVDIPLLVIDGTPIPPANVAALLVGNEPEPAAGEVQSSGGDFAGDPGDIQAAYDLGNLLPYTELLFEQPTEDEVIPALNRTPDVVIETPENPSGVENATATVYENGLPERNDVEPEGTQAPTDSEKTSGSIVLNPGDGIETLTINGDPVDLELMEGGTQTFESDKGFLTITDVDLENGVISFDYELKDNLLDGDTTDVFVVVLTDTTGDVAQADLTIGIIDDAPVATDNLNEVEAGSFGPVEGNVLADDDGFGSDVSGADGYKPGPEGAVASFSNGTDTADAGETLQGEYGKLTIYANGDYVYTRDEGTPGGVEDHFTYQTIDNDDSLSNVANLDITIGDDAPEAEPDTDSVTEDGPLLATGNVITDAEANGDNGADYLSADGITEVTGVVFGTEAGEVTGQVGEEIEGTYGTLTLGEDGEYTYKLDNTNAAVQALDDGETLTETFSYTITDGDDDWDTTTLTITINGANDAPVARADTNWVLDVTEGDDPSTTGNVLDTLAHNGAPDALDRGDVADSDVDGDALTITGISDGGSVGATFTTAHGTLLINSDGSYTYTLDSDDPAVVALDDGETLTEQFTYTVSDGDVPVDATLTITIFGTNDAPEAKADTNWTIEDAVAPITGDVLADIAHGGAPSGSFADVADTDVDVEDLSVANPGVYEGTYGTLTLNEDGSYSYELDNTNPLVQALNEGDEPLTDSFDYTATDGDLSSNSTLTISIFGANDAPVVTGDTGAVSDEGLAGGDADEIGTPTDTTNLATTSGSITITDADDAAFTVTLGVPVASLYSGGEEVQWALSDSDHTLTGSTSAGDVVIVTIDDLGNWSLTLEAPIDHPDAASEDVIEDYQFPVSVSDGTDSTPGAISIDFEDDSPIARADTDSVTEDGPLSATGNVITDAEANGDNGADATGGDGATVTGVAAGDAGSDVSGSVGVEIDGLYGKLTLGADGEYSYTLYTELENPAAYQTVQGLDSTESLNDEIFTYTITDGDTDTSTTTLQIIVNGADDPVVLNGLDLDPAELSFDEDDLPDGSSPDASMLVKSGSFSVDSPDGLATLAVDGTAIYGEGVTYPVVIAGDYGELRITSVVPVTDAEGDVISATVNYEYQLSDNTLDHTAPPPLTSVENDVTDSFTVTATDTDGTPATPATLDVQVIDDIPEATDNENSVEEGGSIGGNVLSDNDGSGVDDPGADGYHADGAVVGINSVNEGTSELVADGDGNFILAGEFGMLTLNENGVYSYQSNANSVNVDEEDVFTYTIRDGDGDETTATLTIDVNNVTGDVSDNDVDVNEAGLPAGSDFGSNSHIDANGQITVENAAGPFTYTLTGPNSDGDGAYGTLVLNVSTGAYTYTLDTPYTDAVDENGPNVVNGAEGFTYEVRDGANNLIGTGTIQINITDDVPTAIADTDSVTDNTSLTADGNVLTGSGGSDANATDGNLDTQGADGATVTGVAAGNAGAVDVSDALSLGAPIVGKYGTLTLNGDGSYSYVLDDTNADVIGLAAGEMLTDEVFTYTITDGDGDWSTTTLTITVNGANDAPEAENDTNWVLDVAAGPDPVTTGNVLDDLAHNGAPDAADRADTADGDIDGDTLSVTAISDGGSVGATFTTAHGTLLINSDGSYTYTLDSDDPAVVALDDGETLTESFTYTVSDGGLTDTATLTITIFGTNDAPEAKADTNWTIEDAGAAITGDVLADVAHGGAPSGTFADVADTDVDVEDLSVANPGIYNGTYGVLTLDADGSYSYELYTELQDQAAYEAVQALNVGDTPLTDSFSYTATDGDLSSNSTLTISIFGANDAPVVTGDTAVVSEEGLSGANADNVGNPTDTTNDFEASGQITITDVDDTSHTVTLGEPTTPGLTSGGLTVNWQVSPDGKALVGSTSAGNVVLVAIDDDGNWTLDLVGPLDHADASDENLLSFDIPVSVSDGVASDDTTITVTVEDDSPVAFTPVAMTDTDTSTGTTQDDSIPNSGSAVVTRLINDADNDGVGTNFIGSDGFGSLTFTGGTDGDVLKDGDLVNVTSGDAIIYLFGFGSDTLVATTDITNTDASAKVFEVTLDEGTGFGNDATYSIEFFQTLDDGSGFVFEDFSSAPAGQNEWMGFDFDGGAINASQNDSEDLLITGLNGGTVNTSSTDIGSNNQWIDENEGIRLDYVVDVAGGGAEKTPQGYTHEGHYAVNKSSFAVLQTKSGNAAVTIALFFDTDTGNIKVLDGTVVDVDISSIVVTNGSGTDVTGSVTITDNGDGTATVSDLLDDYVVSFSGVSDFNAVELSHGGEGDFALGKFGVESAVSGSDIDLSFDVQAEDADGDTSTGTIDFIVSPQSVAPVAIDLDGDGVEFLSLADGVVYDYGEGQVSTAWVDGDDGLLAHKTADGLDIVFTDDAEGATSDLDGLAKAYDSNGDGIFDVSDAAFADFGVWQDANSDGILDEGEFVSLSDAGIVSISLTSDGVGYTAADGDVEVVGTAEVTFADGSTGDAADASFAIEAVMDAMLSMGDDGEFGATTQDMALVAETVSDALTEGAVDTLADSYSAPISEGGDLGGGSSDLSALLSSSTDSGVNVALTLPENVMDDTAMAVVSHG